jgi:hypothetical protein
LSHSLTLLGFSVPVAFDLFPRVAVAIVAAEVATHALSISISISISVSIAISVSITIMLANAIAFRMTIAFRMAIAFAIRPTITISISIPIAVAGSLSIPVAAAATVAVAIPAAALLARVRGGGLFGPLVAFVSASAPLSTALAARSLVVRLEVGEDRSVVLVRWGRGLFARFHLGLRNLRDLDLGLLFGELIVVSGLPLGRAEHVLREVAEPEDSGLDLDDRRLAAILLHHRGEPRAHRDLGGLADVAQEIALDRDLGDAFVVERLADEAKHLHRSFCKSHVIRRRRPPITSADDGGEW